MNDNYALLLELQDKDLRIFNLKKQVISVPTEKERVRHELQISEDQLETVKSSVMDLESKIKQIEMDISDENEQKIKFQQQSVEVRKNDEYKALMNEIERCDKNIAAAEDKQISMWEELEKIKEIFAATEKEFEAGHARIEAAIKDLDVREKNCQAQVEKITSERDALATGVNAELLTHYNRLIARSKLPDGFSKAVVSIRNTNCGGCFLTMTPQVVNRVKKDELINCENCGVFLYYET
ncbi:MAG: C4-type zinc ribbon domain-containing protein [Lentisphaeria bacterium]|nr:C4-type zinc ribbon domain-containing protein [Lentisphaeria bacterium]MDP7739871.1 C4-type zinc ribbon domain-containing protein [Lentisphaeria bacterium]